MTALKPLDSVYHSALRFITGAKYDTHHCILYDKVGWSSLSSRRDYHWFLFIFKTIIGKLPPYLSSLLTQSIGTYQTRSNDQFVFKIPRVRTELGRSAFSYDAPYTWNFLQKSLKLEVLPSFTDFKALALDFCSVSCSCF